MRLEISSCLYVYVIFCFYRYKKALIKQNLGNRIPEVLTAQLNHEHGSKMLINKPRYCTIIMCPPIQIFHGQIFGGNILESK